MTQQLAVMARFDQSKGSTLQRHFGAARLIRSITAAVAGDYRRALQKNYPAAYPAKMIINARTF